MLSVACCSNDRSPDVRKLGLTALRSARRGSRPRTFRRRLQAGSRENRREASAESVRRQRAPVVGEGEELELSQARDRQELFER